MKNIVIIILVVLLLGGAAYFFQQKKIKSLQQEVTQLEQENEKESTPPIKTEPRIVETNTIEEDEKEEELKDEDSETDELTDEDKEDVDTDEVIEEVVLKSPSLTQSFIGAFITTKELKSLLADNNLELPNDGEQVTLLDEGIAAKADGLNRYYFVTTALDEEERTVRRVYSYTQSSDKLRELYWERNTTNLVIKGIDENNLIIAKASKSELEDKCKSTWMVDEIESLDLSDPAAGTNPYTVPQNIRAEEIEKTVVCKF